MKAKGHEKERKAVFKSPKASFGGGEEIELTEATFTKVENGLDEAAKDKALGGRCNEIGRGFFLATGGCGCDEIVENGTKFCCDEQE